MIKEEEPPASVVTADSRPGIVYCVTGLSTELVTEIRAGQEKL
jgi:hypothetical protein